MKSQRIHRILGRGIVYVLSSEERNQVHHLDDVWVFKFEDHLKEVKVRGIEGNSVIRQAALQFGMPFTEEELKLIKQGLVTVYKK